VGRTLVSAAVAVAFQFSRCCFGPAGWILQDKVQVTIQVKGGGQECPPHTGLIDLSHSPLAKDDTHARPVPHGKLPGFELGCSISGRLDPISSKSSPIVSVSIAISGLSLAARDQQWRFSARGIGIKRDANQIGP